MVPLSKFVGGGGRLWFHVQNRTFVSVGGEAVHSWDGVWWAVVMFSPLAKC